jgi:hypothetical protein
MPRHGRSGVVLATVAALAAMLMTFTGCADDAPGPDTPGQGTQVADHGGDVVVSSVSSVPTSAATATTSAPNPYAEAAARVTATSAP